MTNRRTDTPSLRTQKEEEEEEEEDGDGGNGGGRDGDRKGDARESDG